MIINHLVNNEIVNKLLFIDIEVDISQVLVLKLSH